MVPSKILMCMDCGRPHYESEPGAPTGLPAVPPAQADPPAESVPSAETPASPSSERKCRYCGSTLIREQDR